MKKLLSLTLSLLLALSLFSGCQIELEVLPPETQAPSADAPAPLPQDAELILDLDTLPAYSGDPFTVVNGNEPFFTQEEITAEAYEEYSDLDSLGRCQVTFACLGQELMPTEKRGDISKVHPTGWINHPYSWVDGEFLYNRCHLIGFQLAGENANERNLITGTRYMNVDGMLPFENMVADYIHETDNHVMYRVTPIFTGANLVADGVLMEGLSVEDQGDGIRFCVYAYNVQPGVVIDYATGENHAAEAPNTTSGETMHYVLNTGSHKFHLPDCSGTVNMKEKNREDFIGTREELILKGYTPCGSCNP